jgi:hypothetical protein
MNSMLEGEVQTGAQITDAMSVSVNSRSPAS